MPSENSLPKLYTSLASWFHLLTNPADYVEEAEFARQTLVESANRPIRTVLELGSGGGNNAFHLKRSFDMTLVDISADMLELSGRINPECEHLVGDMRDVRLGREFDAVFVHDAVMYMTSVEELAQSLETAYLHCKVGGVALFMPDLVKETFAESVHHGGHDGDGRSLRFFEWTFDPDPEDSTYSVDFACFLREGRSPVRLEHECHVFGLFSRNEWLNRFRDAGFVARGLNDPFGRQIFVGLRAG